MTDRLRSKCDSFSMWVKSALLSPSSIKPHAQPSRCHRTRTRAGTCGCPVEPRRDVKYLCPNLKRLWIMSVPSGKHQPIADPATGQENRLLFAGALTTLSCSRKRDLSPSSGSMQPTGEKSQVHLKAHREQNISMLYRHFSDGDVPVLGSQQLCVRLYTS